MNSKSPLLKRYLVKKTSKRKGSKKNMFYYRRTILLFTYINKNADIKFSAQGAFLEIFFPTLSKYNIIENDDDRSTNNYTMS